MNKFKYATMLLVIASWLSAGVVPVSAEVTPWMSGQTVWSYVSGMGKTYYATKIECKLVKGKLQVRFNTKTVTGKKPFFKWLPVVAKPEEFYAKIKKIPLRERPELKYRVVSQSKVGKTAICAILWR